MFQHVHVLIDDIKNIDYLYSILTISSFLCDIKIIRKEIMSNGEKVSDD